MVAAANARPVLPVATPQQDNTAGQAEVPGRPCGVIEATQRPIGAIRSGRLYLYKLT